MDTTLLLEAQGRPARRPRRLLWRSRVVGGPRRVGWPLRKVLSTGLACGALGMVVYPGQVVSPSKRTHQRPNFRRSKQA